MISLCSGWEFAEQWSDAFASGEGSAEAVRLPHTVRLSPLHLAQPADYEMLCGYRKRLFIPEEHMGKRLFLQFDAAAHIATVFINGHELGTHYCGYTAFRYEITDYVSFGEDNLVTVKLDSSENGAVPPFGYVIDYLTYGGLYREAWLDVRNREFIEDVFVRTPSPARLEADISLNGAASGKVRLSVLDGDAVLARTEGSGTIVLDCPEAKVWDAEAPQLYTARAELLGQDGEVLDTVDTVFGFRTIEFRADGFFLNGKKFFLRGLNRHQCYPYIGYAAPERLQREDARILKHELQCTAVRTSHYPQSRYFIDECDRLGLLVFTEIPGWQHIGGENWKEICCENVREMVLQYRNHPSIVLWGVRVNESGDDDELYTRTNAIARELDPSRPTSGVRFLEKSHLLEDVYAYNDFSHTGDNPGVKNKKLVCADMSAPLLVSEHNGHMFPTKAYDPWRVRQEQALRHARVQNDARADGQHAGCFGWCMFDYPTHRDFGSGDRVCYHGVMDTFRNPKLAASLYASQGEEEPVLEIGSCMDKGDYPASIIPEVYAFTNADELELYRNDVFVSRFTPKKGAGLAHPPVLIDDTIGELLKSVEGMDGGKERLLRKCLKTACGKPATALPLGTRLGMAWAMLRYKMKYSDFVDLYGKYVGNWGAEVTRWRFVGKKDGKVVAERLCCPGSTLHIEARVSSLLLKEGDAYDMSLVRIRILDENGNCVPYAQLPLSLKADGDICLVGPDTVTAEGGMCGCYVRTVGRAGSGRLTVSAPGAGEAVLEFTVE